MTPASTLAVLFATLSPQSSDHFADDAGQDALSYELDLDVDPAARALSGTVRYRFRAVEELDEVQLDALPDEAYSVEFQRPDGSPWEAIWTDQRVILRLPEPVPAGAELEFTARLRGRPSEGFYFKDTRDGAPIAFTDHYAVRARGWLP